MKAIKGNCISIMIFMFISCPILGQDLTKRDLTEHDYYLWSTIEMREMSAKGSWVSYNLSYEKNTDTLVVRNINAQITYKFPKGYGGYFAENKWFGCLTPGKKFHILKLDSGKTTEQEGVLKFAFSNDGKVLVTLNDQNQITVRHLNEKKVQIIENGVDFYFNPAGTAFVYTTSKEKYALKYYLLNGAQSPSKELTSSDQFTFENIIWQKNGNSFSFIKQYKEPLSVKNGKNLSLYRLKESKTYEFETEIFSAFDKESTIDPPLSTRFTISDDGKRVFFYYSKTAPVEEKIVQIWNGNDAWAYPQTQMEGQWNKISKCGVWFPDDNNFAEITTEELPKFFLSGDQKYAISYNPMGNKPQFTMMSKADWFVTNINTGFKSVLVKDLLCDMSEIHASFGGRYIIYRKSSDWWVYELNTGRHKNISSKIPYPIYDIENDYAGLQPAFGIAGWTKNDKEVIIYDEYDLWLVNLNNFDAKRITHGREKNSVFRIAHPYDQADRLMNFDGYTIAEVNLNSGLYLTAKDKFTKQMGYYLWKETEKKLVFTNKLLTQLRFKKGCNTIYYKEQDFDQSPSIKAINKSAMVDVAETNTHQHKFNWGYSKLIKYRNSKNELLQGALYYPSNYNPDKKYPMIVCIYEKLSQYVHQYVNPTLYNTGGFNSTNLTTQGYFVLQPDINFEMDNVGNSATDCVLAATNEVIARGLVLPDKIALIGHSFGGYQAAYIATQTNKFSTVIVGGGISNLLSHYLSIGWNTGRPESFRYEDQQWRMSTSLYENMNIYLKNSPIMSAPQITTPILIWTGEQDRQVHYFQSIELYNALRRLNKKQIMLIYPENRHVLTVAKHQIDFTRKFEDWVATYLKDTPPSEWIKKGVE